MDGRQTIRRRDGFCRSTAKTPRSTLIRRTAHHRSAGIRWDGRTDDAVGRRGRRTYGHTRQTAQVGDRGRRESETGPERDPRCVGRRHITNSRHCVVLPPRLDWNCLVIGREDDDMSIGLARNRRQSTDVRTERCDPESTLPTNQVVCLCAAIFNSRRHTSRVVLRRTYQHRFLRGRCTTAVRHTADVGYRQQSAHLHESAQIRSFV